RRHVGNLFIVHGRRPRATLFPYTTLFRSHPAMAGGRQPIHDQLVAEDEHLDVDGVAGDGDGGEGGRPDAVARMRDEYLDTPVRRSEEHTSELQSRENLVCRPLLEKKKCRV